jgi:multimeric flavodoxin WrbA
MAKLLVVHHTPSPATHAMFEAVMAGAGDDAIEGVEVVARAALAATAVDVLGADGYVLGTPANIGYMSGALKHFFDTVYYPCLDETAGRPYALYVHGDNDATGAIRAVESIATGLRWRKAREPLAVTGRPGRDELDACWELGATVAAGLTLDA